MIPRAGLYASFLALRLGLTSGSSVLVDSVSATLSSNSTPANPIPPASAPGTVEMIQLLQKLRTDLEQHPERAAFESDLAGDVDGDGLPVLFFCAEGGSCALYRNLGDGKFQDVTVAAGVACTGWDVTGAALADINGDGHLEAVEHVVSRWHTVPGCRMSR